MIADRVERRETHVKILEKEPSSQEVADWASAFTYLRVRGYSIPLHPPPDHPNPPRHGSARCVVHSFIHSFIHSFTHSVYYLIPFPHHIKPTSCFSFSPNIPSSTAEPIEIVEEVLSIHGIFIIY